MRQKPPRGQPPTRLAPGTCLRVVPLLIPGTLSKVILPGALVHRALLPSSFLKQGENRPLPLTDTSQPRKPWLLWVAQLFWVSDYFKEKLVK